jgi:hypothetical protein
MARTKSKAKDGAFEHDPNCPRFVPLKNRNLVFRNPITGKSYQVSVDEAFDFLNEMDQETPLYKSMSDELDQIHAKWEDEDRPEIVVAEVVSV